MVFRGYGKREMESDCYYVQAFSYEDENALSLDCGDSGTTLWIDENSLNYTL